MELGRLLASAQDEAELWNGGCEGSSSNKTDNLSAPACYR